VLAYQEGYGMYFLRQTTPRLDLVAGTMTIFRLNVYDNTALAQHLGAEVSATWPPAHYDQHVLDYAATCLAANPLAVGWLMWYMLLRDEMGDRPVLIGYAGFAGAPSPQGMVEMGYAVLPAYHGRGYASEAVRALITWAFDHDEVTTVCAQTCTDHAASLRVMEKNGLCYAGIGAGEKIARYELTRAAYLATGGAHLQTDTEQGV
jgi:RimJ/RimL family protein N-acetyltransferase